jgi:hypothetical protein
MNELKELPQARYYYAGDVIEFTSGDGRTGDVVNTKAYTVLTSFDLKLELEKYKKFRGEMYQSCQGAGYWLVDNLDLEEHGVQIIKLGSYELKDLDYTDETYDPKKCLVKLNENKS